MLRTEVCVVGGGPAGAAAAITLARAGREVHLVDKAVFPRDKTCGDGLTAGALRRLEALGLRADSVPSWQPVWDVEVRSPSGHLVPYPMPQGQGLFAAVAPRIHLDAALLDLARAAGVKVHDGHALTGVTPGLDSVVLDVEGVGAIEATYAVAADGQWSPTAKALGLYPTGYLGEWHAFRQYFSGVAQPAATELWVWFEPDLLPGYAWSFPLPGGRANVGFGIQRTDGQSVQSMKDLWPELLARPHIRSVLGEEAVADAPHRAWPIPARIDTAILAGAGGRVLFVGDAAGACDPMTGEGIGQALETAMLAAAAIEKAGPGAPAWASWRYRRDVWKGLRRDHHMSMLLVRALRHRKGARAAVRVSGLTAWTRRNFARWLFEDYPRAAIVTPGRWRRDLFSGPGAYVDRWH